MNVNLPVATKIFKMPTNKRYRSFLIACAYRIDLILHSELLNAPFDGAIPADGLCGFSAKTVRFIYRGSIGRRFCNKLTLSVSVCKQQAGKLCSMRCTRLIRWRILDITLQILAQYNEKPQYYSMRM